PHPPLSPHPHNLHPNALNVGFDAAAALRRLPIERVTAVHLAGGKWIPAGGPGDGRRLPDDHRHEVPDPVFDLLRELGARAPAPLTVVIERDGRFPPVGALLAGVDRARAALAEGRRPGPARVAAA